MARENQLAWPTLSDVTERARQLLRTRRERSQHGQCAWDRLGQPSPCFGCLIPAASKRRQPFASPSPNVQHVDPLFALVAHEGQVTLVFSSNMRLRRGRLFVGQGVPGLLTVSRCSTTSSISSKKGRVVMVPENLLTPFRKTPLEGFESLPLLKVT